MKTEEVKLWSYFYPIIVASKKLFLYIDKCNSESKL